MGSNFQNDIDDMKRVLVYFKMPEVIKDLNLITGPTMKTVQLKSTKVEGFNNVLIESTRNYPKCKKFSGRSPEQRALIRQWLQYCILYLRGKYPTPYVLKEMDNALALTTFFGGHSLSLVDPVLYLSLYPIYCEMSFYDKEKYPNLSRWFRLIQEDDTLRKANKKVLFSRTPLYNSISAHP